MTSIPMDRVVVRRSDIVANDLSADEMVMLDVERGVYFGLRDVGKFIWAGLETPTTVEALCASVLDAFDVSEETCRREVVEFLEELFDQELIDVGPAQPNS